MPRCQNRTRVTVSCQQNHSQNVVIAFAFFLTRGETNVVIAFAFFVARGEKNRLASMLHT